jgi:hypothetical protein
LAKERDLSTSPERAAALIILGHDSLLGSLGASLLAVLEGSAGERRLCDLTYPDALPATGVPYVERVARTDCQIGEFKFREGERVRLFLDACPARGSAGEETPFFGKGRHLCIGRELSQWTWRVLAQQLARVPHRVRVTATRLRPHDYIFNMYDSIEVSIDG